jgi:preprotein translocase subunit SecD
MQRLIASLAMICVIICGCNRRREAASGQNPVSAVPQFYITDQDLQSVSPVDGAFNQNSSGPFVISIKLNGNKSTEFHDFTANHLNQKVQVIVGTNIVVEPVIRAILSGQDIVISRPSLNDANALMKLLKQRPIEAK